MSGWGSGHQAGYDWAQENGVTDKSQCPQSPNGSTSFTAGCESYVDEQNRKR